VKGPRGIILVLLALSCLGQASPGYYTLKFGEHSAFVELAATPEERAHGLMFRETLEENHGMLFVFERPAVYSFWMKNTLIPLAIAFLDQDGVIVNIEEMLPRDERHVSSGAKVVYALEMNAGWFRQRGIALGARALFDEKITKRLKR